MDLLTFLLMYEFICVLFLFKQNSTREFMSNRRVVLRESVSVLTAGIGKIGAYLRERRISKLDIKLLLSCLICMRH